MVVMAGRTAGAPVVVGPGRVDPVVGRIRRALAVVVAADVYCMINLEGRGRWPLRRMGQLMLAILNAMQAERRHEGGAKTDAKGAEKAMQG